jgi:hypothetical protein
MLLAYSGNKFRFRSAVLISSLVRNNGFRPSLHVPKVLPLFNAIQSVLVLPLSAISITLFACFKSNHCKCTYTLNLIPHICNVIKFRIICLLLLFSSTIFAQDYKFNAGFIAGISTSQVDGDQLAGYNKAGIKAGVFVNRNFSEPISMQMELLFIQKGSRKPVNTDDNSYFVMRLNYIEVPLMFRYRLSKKIIAEAGPSAATLVSSEEVDEVGVILSRPPFHKFDFDVNAGGYYLLSENWSFNFRFSYSIVPIRPFDSARPYAFFDRGQFNNVLAICLGYQF